MQVIKGAAAIMAYEVCIAHGNHNNASLIDREVLICCEKLWAMQIIIMRKYQEDIAALQEDRTDE